MIVQPEDATVTGIFRAMAITLTIVTVMAACYEGLLRAQRKAATQVLRHQEEVAGVLRAVLQGQRNEIRRTRKKIAEMVDRQDAQTQECMDELGARVQHLADLTEAHSLLLSQSRQGGPIPAQTGQIVPMRQPHG